MQSLQILRLDAASESAVQAIIPVKLAADDAVGSWVTISRVGTFTDPRYGTFTLSREMFEQMIQNFKGNVVGQEIAIDLNHDTSDGAAGYIKELVLQKNTFRGRIEWTPMGIEAIKMRGFKYMSAEIHPNFTDNETREEHGATLLGAGLVVRPAIKRLDPVELLETESGQQIFLSDAARTSIREEYTMKFAALLKKLKEKLTALNLAAKVVDSVLALAEKGLEVATDDSAAQLIVDNAFKMGEELHAAIGNNEGVVNISLSLDAGSETAGLNKDDVVQLLADAKAAAEAEIVQLEEKKKAKVKLFTDVVNKEDNGLDETARKQIMDDSLALIDPAMADDSIVALAEKQVEIQNRIIAAAKKAEMNMSAGGAMGQVILVEAPIDNAIRLSGLINEKLKRSMAFANGQIKLQEKVHPFVDEVLTLFDFQNQINIHAELLVLADGTGMGQTELPVGFQREVIREALSDLNVLDLVQTLVDATATATMQIPYETREVSAASLNAGVVYERAAIPRARVRQQMDLAYISAMKIAIECSNEVLHFSANSGINWDAWGRNVGSAARLMRELVHMRIANELQRVADAFGAAAVVAEDISGQLGGATSIIKTASFPVVQPKQIYDLQGNAVGAAQNALTIDLNGTAATEYDGSNTQAAGTYFSIINHNLGYVQLVSELGVPVTPALAVATISYFAATNIKKVDLDVPANTKASDHLDTLLDAVGSRKAVLRSNRFVEPDFLLMSSVLNDICTNATTFRGSEKRDARDTDLQGDLERVKAIESYKSDAPGIHLGDERILIGQRGILSYGISKPWSMSDMIEGRTAAGVLNATKEAYGEEYNTIHVPLPNRDRFTSVIAYSFTGR